MKLLIDAGNTRLKWCWYDGEDLPLEFKSAEYDDFDAEGVELFKTSGPDVDDILICNVGGDALAESFREMFSEWGVQPRFVQSQANNCGVTNAYDQPEQLGVDRWMAMQGAWSLQQDAVCIVDCGTAVTIDVLDDEGLHLGGMIVPGVELMQEALLDETDGISLDESTQADSLGLLARDTTNAVVAGTLYALVALIDRVRQDIAEELDCDLPLILSGGDVDLIQPLLSCEARHEPMLVFQGMLAVDEGTE